MYRCRSRGGAIAVEKWETGAEVVVDDAKGGAEMAQWTATMPVPSSTAGRMNHQLLVFLRPSFSSKRVLLRAERWRE